MLYTENNLWPKHHRRTEPIRSPENKQLFHAFHIFRIFSFLFHPLIVGFIVLRRQLARLSSFFFFFFAIRFHLPSARRAEMKYHFSYLFTFIHKSETRDEMKEKTFKFDKRKERKKQQKKCLNKLCVNGMIFCVPRSSCKRTRQQRISEY